MTAVQIGAWIAGVLGTLLGTGGVIKMFTIRAENQRLLAEAEKTGADTATVLSAAALSLVGPLQAEIERLSKKVVTLEAQIDAMSKKLEWANQLLIEHPEWTPPGGIRRNRG